MYISVTSGFELEPKPPKSWEVGASVCWGRGWNMGVSQWLHDGGPHSLRLENWEEKIEINESSLPWKLVLSTDCVST